jgi:hypothetical protein
MLHLGKRSWRPYAALSAALVSLAVVLSISGSAGAASKAAVAPRPAAVAPRAALIPTDGVLSTTSAIHGLTSDGRTVAGNFKPLTTAVTSGGRLVVRGTLNMLVKGDVPVRISKVVNLPVQSIGSSAASATTAATTTSGAVTTAALTSSAVAPAALPAGACQILNLVLGPLHLDLLGLVIDLNQVILNIIAQSGAGNLLGNLLCAVAGLLDGSPLSGLLGQLSTLLNSILAILNQ